jgi:predicted MFS family arabinose efflux permease
LIKLVYFVLTPKTVTVPIAVYSEKFNARKYPMVIGTIILIGSQIMFMEAPVYWLMCVARVLQGLGSTMIWVVGMALVYVFPSYCPLCRNGVHLL